MRELGGRAFGKKRAPDCTCTYNSTCSACMKQAEPIGAPQRPSQSRQAQEDRKRRSDGSLGHAGE